MKKILLLFAPFGALFLILWWLMDKKRKETFQGSKYFTAPEFGLEGWRVTPELLAALDAFRELVGAPVSLSAAEGAIIRTGTGTSQHYFGRAADVVWPKVNGKRLDAGLVRQYAIKAGFKGLGVYPWGFHLDVRPSEKPGLVASWGRPVGGRADGKDDLTFSSWVSAYGERGQKA